jgi:serine/threonine protein kinase
LTRIESEAFSYSSLQSISIPSKVEIVGSRCFAGCRSLSSISFQFPSQLKRIEGQAFGLVSSRIVICSTILFLASDAVSNPSQISLVEGDSCPEFDRWQQVRRSGITIDFRRILRVGSGLAQMIDYEVNLSGFEERLVIDDPDRFSNQLYWRSDDQISMIVKSISLSEPIEKSELEKEIENLINLRHPCIAAPIGFVVPRESSRSQELKIARLSVEGCSLAEVISINPVWWTATVKSQTVAGIVLALRFAHSLGLLHGCLGTSNILFDVDHRIQIGDFGPIRLTGHETEGIANVGGFYGEGWNPKTDVSAFVSILIEIMVGHPVNGETSLPKDVPQFISRIIEAGLSSETQTRRSFRDIFEILRRNDFRIMAGVDSEEVLAFVRWVESTEEVKE